MNHRIRASGRTVTHPFTEVIRARARGFEPPALTPPVGDAGIGRGSSAVPRRPPPPPSMNAMIRGQIQESRDRAGVLAEGEAHIEELLK